MNVDVKRNQDQSIYVNTVTKLTIYCNVHSKSIELTPSQLFRKAYNPCNKCNQPIVNDKSQYFIERSNQIHNNKYDYSLTIYVNTDSKVIIKCPIHGQFQTTPTIHLRGHACRLCANDSQKLTLQQFIEKSQKVHGTKFDYSDVKYINGNSKVIIKCDKDHMFQQSPYSHQQGMGCPQCSFRKTELKLYEYLKQQLPQYEIETQKRFEFCRNPETNAHLPIDFYIPQLNTSIELQGDQHFRPVRFWKNFEAGLRRDLYKKQ